ncbi:hypothetical protein [Streptomyces sp. URMC 129]|uniref:hypothetical protein n=1 Tax=Streptomyces sp. URMC 129 TaxID=3423407 RepID=UPI003F1C4B31
MTNALGTSGGADNDPGEAGELIANVFVDFIWAEADHIDTLTGPARDAAIKQLHARITKRAEIAARAGHAPAAEAHLVWRCAQQAYDAPRPFSAATAVPDAPPELAGLLQDIADDEETAEERAVEVCKQSPEAAAQLLACTLRLFSALSGVPVNP